jgi:hypothetical protein
VQFEKDRDFLERLRGSESPLVVFHTVSSPLLVSFPFWVFVFIAHRSATVQLYQHIDNLSSLMYYHFTEVAAHGRCFTDVESRQL